MSSSVVAGPPPSPLPERLRRRLDALTLHQRIHLVGVAAFTVVAVLHHAVLWRWFIEDAAISWAYARNVAAGEGLVPWPGGERVEGYSNPTWVALLALVELVGLDAERAVPWLQAALVAVTVPLTYLVGREAADRDDSHIPLLAAGFLATYTQFAIWSSSGLENALFNALLAVALWRLLVESRTGGFPWSGIWFFLVAISRPEALLYAAIGGGCALVFTLAAGHGPRPTLRWLAAFSVPFVAYHGARYAYFAWELPNTYYAKIGDHKEPHPFAWNRRGWSYVRDWIDEVGLVGFVPVAFLGMSGGRGWRALAGIAVTLAVALSVLLPGDQALLLPAVLGFCYASFYASLSSSADRPSPAVAWSGLLLVGAFLGAAEIMRAQGYESSLPSPPWLTDKQPAVVLLAALGLPFLSLGTRGWQARVACWGMACASVFFAVLVLGDWMKGFRWFSLLSVPLAVVLACGASALGDLAQRVLGLRSAEAWTAPGYAAAVLSAAAWVPPNLAFTEWFDAKPETSPYAIKTRVEFTDAVLARIFAERPYTNLDVDQGGHLWWGDFRMLDIAGLIDGPFAHNKFEHAFVEEYLFEETRPQVAHVHGGWATNSRIPMHAAWKTDYFQIPGYPAGKAQVHPGNHLRRDLVLVEGFRGWSEHPTVRFDTLASLVDFRLPSPEVVPGRYVYVEVAVRRGTRVKDFRMLVFASRDSRLVGAWELPPSYDWIRPRDWRDEEVFVGRFALPTPADLGMGATDLGVVVLDATGRVTPPTWVEGAPPPGIEVADPVLAHGEVRFPGAGPRGVAELQAEAALADDLADARARADAGDCEGAEHGWWLARMHRPRATDWHAEQAPGIGLALAECWAHRADRGDPTAPDTVAALRRAQGWDHRAPTYLEVAARAGRALHAAGLEAREREAWDEAYAAFEAAVRVDPRRAWSRRRAEEMRALKHGYDRDTKARQAEERERERLEAAERAERRKAERQGPPAPGGDPRPVGPPLPEGVAP